MPDKLDLLILRLEYDEADIMENNMEHAGRYLPEITNALEYLKALKRNGNKKEE